ncbi:MAG: twin-arginine translocase subunit TatC, partial [Planctomycetota bacterium]
MSESETADDPDEGELEPTRMTLGEHLDELRSRLIKSVGLLALVFLGCWLNYEEIGKIVLQPGARAIAMFDEARFGLYEEKLLADPELDPELYFIETGSG